MKLSATVLKAFEKHVLRDYPNEAVGVLVGKKYIPCRNIHEEPTKAFRIDPSDLIAAEAKGLISAILHSHPYHPLDKSVFEYYADPRWPSVVDQEQFSTGKEAWVIVATDGTGISEPVVMDHNERPPLLEREFIWGVQDCYSLLRDYYKEKLGIELPFFPREWAFWNKGQDMFTDKVVEAGFKRIPYEMVEVNDIAFFKNESKVANHIGIVSGNNELMQQGVGSLSRISRLDLYHRNVIMYLRYVGKENVKNN